MDIKERELNAKKMVKDACNKSANYSWEQIVSLVRELDLTFPRNEVK